MAEFPVSGDALKKLIQKSRAEPIAFGYNPGTADDDDEYLAAHINKSPEFLGKMALTEGAGTKSAFGTFVISDSELHLRCERVLPQLAKKFKKYLKRNKITLNVVVMDIDGNVVESDIETSEALEYAGAEEVVEVAPEPAAAAPEREKRQEPPPKPKVDPRSVPALVKRMKSLQKGFAVVPPQLLPRLEGAFNGAIELIRNGDVEAGAEAVGKLEVLMGGLMRTIAAQAAAKRRGEAPVEAPKKKAKPDPRLKKLRVVVPALAKLSVRQGWGGTFDGPLREAARRVALGEADAALTLLRGVQTRMRQLQAAG